MVASVIGMGLNLLVLQLRASCVYNKLLVLPTQFTVLNILDLVIFIHINVITDIVRLSVVINACRSVTLVRVFKYTRSVGLCRWRGGEGRGGEGRVGEGRKRKGREGEGRGGEEREGEGRGGEEREGKGRGGENHLMCCLMQVLEGHEGDHIGCLPADCPHHQPHGPHWTLPLLLHRIGLQDLWRQVGPHSCITGH